MKVVFIPLSFLHAVNKNGNITPEGVNGLQISYNFLNLPTQIFCWGDYPDYYAYLADGTKIGHEYSDGQRDLCIVFLYIAIMKRMVPRSAVDT